MIKREEACCVPELCTLRRVRLMNLCEAQSEPRHYATNFSIIVLFVNQCLFIMDAITAAAWFLFFSPPCGLNNHSLQLLSLPRQSININGFQGITERAHEAADVCLCFTCNLSPRSVLPSQTKKSFVQMCTHTHTRTHTSFRSCPSYDLPNLNLNSDLKGAVCRI